MYCQLRMKFKLGCVCLDIHQPNHANNEFSDSNYGYYFFSFMCFRWIKWFNNKVEEHWSTETSQFCCTSSFAECASTGFPKGTNLIMIKTVCVCVCAYVRPNYVTEEEAMAGGSFIKGKWVKVYVGFQRGQTFSKFWTVLVLHDSHTWWCSGRGSQL